MSTNPTTEKKWKSIAFWPAEAGCAQNQSEDLHYTESEACGVCRLLERNGFGGDGVHFPLRTVVEPVASTNPTTDAGNIAGTPLTDCTCNGSNSDWQCAIHGMEAAIKAVEAEQNHFTQRIADLERQLTKSREATAQAERQRDEALARIKCPTCRRSIAVCKCVSLGSFAFDVNTGEVLDEVPKRQCPVKQLRADLSAARAERDGRETDLMAALKDLAAETAKNAELREKLAIAEKALNLIANNHQYYRSVAANALAALRGNDKAEKGA